MSVGQKSAIVTAAGRGIGLAVARELHARGYRLALLSPSGSAAAVARELGGIGRTGSVTNPDDLAALVADAERAFGRIDAVVNNTGAAAQGALLEISDDDWHAGVDMVFLNVVRMARLVTPIMVAQGGGAIVNISTYAAFEPDPAYPVSSCMRAALAGYTKLFADRYAVQGIRINNVLPGLIDNYPTDEVVRARIPAGRYGRVSEVAKTVGFLLSDDAGYITGQNIRVDGALTRHI
ncbi:MAG: SDR family oxidoreductase [Proteobacteria bacterium]|nr:SDR family oxidoreductase [Pseudomonadota bacterium]